MASGSSGRKLPGPGPAGGPGSPGQRDGSSRVALPTGRSVGGGARPTHEGPLHPTAPQGLLSLPSSWLWELLTRPDSFIWGLERLRAQWEQAGNICGWSPGRGGGGQAAGGQPSEDGAGNAFAPQSCGNPGPAQLCLEGWLTAAGRAPPGLTQ